MPKVEIRNEENIVLARHEIRNLADELGFSIINKTRLATAVSELSRNTLVHGQGGHMVFQALRMCLARQLWKEMMQLKLYCLCTKNLIVLISATC